MVLGLGVPHAAQSAESASPAQLEKAKKILHEVPLMDGHNDVPWQYRKRSLAEGAAKILKRPVTEAELLGDQSPPGSRVFISYTTEDSSAKELISRLMNELYDPDTMPAGSDKEKVVIALARHLRKQASK